MIANGKLFVRAVLTLVAASILHARAGVCLADVKDSIFRDCDKALASFRSRPAPERISLIPFLREVLKLKVEAIQPSLPLATRPGMPSPETDVANIWRSFSSDREIDAKRCALTMLREVGVDGAAALPEILGLAPDPGLSDDFHNLLDEIAFNFANLIATATPAQMSETFTLAPVLAEHAEVLGDIVLAALPVQQAVNQALKTLANRGPEPISNFEGLPAWLDPSGEIVQSELLSVYATLNSPQQRASVLNSLKFIACPNVRTLRLLRDELSNPDASLQSLAGRLLTQFVSIISRSPACVAPQATLTGLDTLLLLLEDLPSAEDPALAGAVSKVAQRMHLIAPLLRGRTAAKVGPYIERLLQSSGPESSAGIEAVAALGAAGLDLLHPLLASADEPLRRNITTSLLHIQAIDTKRLRPFLSLLCDSSREIRSNALERILPAAKELRPDLKKLASECKPHSLELSVAVLEAGAVEAEHIESVRDTITAAPCETNSEVLQTLVSALPALQETVERKATQCLGGPLGADCAAARWAALLTGDLPKDLEAQLKTPGIEWSPSCLQIFRKQSRLAALLTLSEEQIGKALRDPDQNVFDAIIAMLPSITASEARKMGTLKEYLLDPQSQPTRRCEVARVAQEAGADQQFWDSVAQRWVDQNFTGMAICLRCSPKPLLITGLRSQLASAATRDKPAAIRLLGLMGSAAQDALPEILTFSKSGFLPARYEAIVAALRILETPDPFIGDVNALLHTRRARQFISEWFSEKTLRALSAQILRTSRAQELSALSLEQRLLAGTNFMQDACLQSTPRESPLLPAPHL